MLPASRPELATAVQILARCARCVAGFDLVLSLLDQLLPADASATPIIFLQPSS